MHRSHPETGASRALDVPSVAAPTPPAPDAVP
jgi:hypothetical protein